METVEIVSILENISRIPREIIFETYYLILELLESFLRVYNVLISARITISWFLIINPYFYPFSLLWAITEPAVRWGTEFYPKMFGVSWAFQINMIILNVSLKIVKFLIKDGAVYHSYIHSQH